MKVWALVPGFNALVFGVGLFAIALMHWQPNLHFIALAAFYGGAMGAASSVRRVLEE